MYRWIFDNLITHSNPETAHKIVMEALRVTGNNPLTRAALKAAFNHTDTSIAPNSSFLPKRLHGRLGLAAGMDKNAEAIAAFIALGFGFVEIGTITPKPQPGNPSPRLWRIPETQEIRNQMGFNNHGVQAAKQKLTRLRATQNGKEIVVGANIGKNKLTPNEEALNDYRICARELAPLADFIVINVSSPNTPGLRDLQSVEALKPILQVTKETACEAANREIPVFVKIAPDLVDEDILHIGQIVNETNLAGVVAANTTIKHSYGSGGISGPRLLGRGLNIVQNLRQELNYDKTIIATGGISTIDDAISYLDAGADLLEALTAFIYQGPSWPAQINRAIQNYR
ncbi:quinone-dependent dihydroorotate dehydrogenase [Gleimia sp. 6138-11-ORH1]|uniref:quinone-dependent dihydroorotate dehydrogenase n=1 Tax=Gleimia sp. 6138-11-ORH1 TaxID=2973937 RepID=UPI0021679643|nr:quinone-dependent dihydroorotate dehydrogenase [Gleimia sp. 6138-11-ORH1]MCS4484458.1 quinone-dependent dihydroorotate dehydrogenase [Gleimia sp. 6138-11-ORH1]